MSAKRAPPAAPASLTRAPPGYAKWIADVKQRVRAAQIRASVAVNHELVALYWSIGRDLLDRRAKSTWGDGVIDRASADLRAEFPNMEGFSRSNLKYMRQFAEAWPDVDEIRQQPVGQLCRRCLHNRAVLDEERAHQEQIPATKGPSATAR